MDKIDEVLSVIDSYSIYSYHKQRPSWEGEAILKAEQKGYVIRYDKGKVQLTRLGDQVLRSGMGWEIWERTNGSQTSNTIINIENNNQSPFLSHDIKFDNPQINNNIPTAKSKTSLTQRIVWTIAIITGLLAIYTFFKNNGF